MKTKLTTMVQALMKPDKKMRVGNIRIGLVGLIMSGILIMTIIPSQPVVAAFKSDKDISSACGAKLKERFGDPTAQMLLLCETAYKIIKNSSPYDSGAAVKYCQQAPKGERETSACGLGQDLAKADAPSGGGGGGQGGGSGGGGSSQNAGPHSTDCNNKATKKLVEKCKKEVKECVDPKKGLNEAECRRLKATKIEDVMASCREATDQQACHEKVAKACGKKKGDDKKKCEERRSKAIIKRQEAVKKAKTSTEGASIFGANDGEFQCGNQEDAVQTRFDFGCLEDSSDVELGPIEDLLFSIIRFLSAGVGIVIVLSIVAAGIQYASSEGSPEATQAAKNRIQNAIIGLVVYLFAFSVIQFLVPGGVFSLSVIQTHPILLSIITEVT